jgi:lysophospholipase
LVVYVPNYPWSFQSNTSTYKLAYEEEEAQALIANGMRTLTLNNTIENWSTCLACA